MMKRIFIGGWLVGWAMGALAASQPEGAGTMPQQEVVSTPSVNAPSQLKPFSLHPACLAVFNGNMGHVPYVTALDVAECQKDKRAKVNVFSSNPSRVCFHKNKYDSTMGDYCYEWIGKTAQNVQVFHTFNMDSKGKQRDMLMLMVVKFIDYYHLPFSSSPIRSNKGPFLAMTGYIPGGNHCQGGIQSVTLQQSVLTITQYPKNNKPDDCHGAIKYSMDLAALQGTNVLIPM